MKLAPVQKKLIERADKNFRNMSTVRNGSLVVKAWNRYPCCRVFVSGKEIKLA